MSVEMIIRTEQLTKVYGQGDASVSALDQVTLADPGK